MPATLEHAPVSCGAEAFQQAEIEPLLSKSEAARILGTSIRSVEKWIADGLLRATYLGSLVKIDKADLRDFLTRAKQVERKPRRA